MDNVTRSRSHRVTIHSVTASRHLRLHPWLPVLTDPCGRVRLRVDRRSAPLPEDLGRAVTTALRGLRDPTAGPGTGPGWRTLVATGHVVDADEVARSAAQGGDPLARAHLSRHAVDPLQAGRVRRRADTAVTVNGPDTLTGPIRAALAASGLQIGSGGQTGASQSLRVHVGRPSAGSVHQWMHGGLRHLVVVPRAASVRVGPLVDPGATACLQCLSLARSDRDAAWPLLAERLARTTVPTPDPMLVGHAAALVARAVVSVTETGECALMGNYWVVGLDDPVPRQVGVDRHPTCGCWWPVPPATGFDA